MPPEFPQLKELVQLIADKKIAYITQFHTKAMENGIYVAVKGTTYDGAEFITDAIAHGASYIVGEFEDLSIYLNPICKLPLASISIYGCGKQYDDQINTIDDCNSQVFIINGKRIKYYKVNNARKALSYLCNMLFLAPEESEQHQAAMMAPKEISLPIRVAIPKVAAVTGTNGKTSVAHFYAQLAYLAGFDSMSIGTMGGIHFNHNEPKLDLFLPNLTTPSAEDLYRAISTCKKHGISFVAIEASSHGLDQHRLEYLEFAAVGFTNFSHDHLDYHHTVDNYFASKRRLFSDIQAKVAVINADIPEYTSLKQASESSGKLVITYGCNQSNLQIIEFRDGEYFVLNFNGQYHKIKTRLVGLFQIYNLLCAFGMFTYSGMVELAEIPPIGHTTIALNQAFQCLNAIVEVPGRLEFVASFKNARVYIDYAHTPDALELVLKELRRMMNQTQSSKLITIIGCGGDRDKIKRPMMGKIAAKLADITIVTDDNPRSEKAEQIRHEIIAGVESKNHNSETTKCQIIEVADRYNAIKTGFSLLQSGDVLLIAGKGHEDYQIIGNDRLNFSDRKVVLEIINLHNNHN